MKTALPRFLAVTIVLGALVLAACGGAATPTQLAPPPASAATEAPAQAPATESSPKPSGEPIRLAYLDSFSGPFVYSGTHGLNGATLAVEEINAAGGLLGRPVQLLSADDKGDPQEGVSAMRDLTSDPTLLAVAGITSSGVAAAVSQSALERKVPLVLKGSYARFLTEEAGHRYLFRVAASGRTLAWVTAQAASSKYSTVCTIANDFAYGHDITDISLEYLKKLYPNIRLIQGCQYWPTLDESDMTSYVSAIASAAPDIIIFSGLPAAAGPFIRQGQAAGLFDRVGAAINATGGSLEELDALTEQEVPPHIIVGSDFPYPVVDAAKGFYSTYIARFKGEKPDSSSAMAYVAIKTIAAGITKAGVADREKLIDAMEGITVEYPTGDTAILQSFDHQSTVGWWIGNLIWDAGSKTAVLGDLRYVDAKGVLLSADEIKALRAAP